MVKKLSLLTSNGVSVQRQESVLPEEAVGRGQWSGQFDFLMSMVAYAVGLGNVWRFPYLCFKNGGGSFLVAYFTFWAIAVVPIMLMEVTAGQYLQRGGIELWNICPIFKGVGLGNVVIAVMCCAYYCVIVTWALYYLFTSIYAVFTGVFPWETCNNWWNTETCITGRENISVLQNMKSNLSAYGLQTETSIEQFWEKRVLLQSDSISNFGGIQWELFAVMVIAWIIIYFALWKGITEARKFIYFCALSPYVLLLILFIRGVTLPGASVGLKYYLMPNVTKLADIGLWKDAGTQVFYSFGVGFGTLIALGSHNTQHHNCYRDGLLLCVINSATSIFSGLVVFSILGYKSELAGKDIAEIVKPGVGLAFQAYPEVASALPLKQLWAILFFIMLSILGIDSQVCMMEGFVLALEDRFPNILRKYRKLSMAGFCIIFFIIGIPMVSYAGSYWLTLVDNYGPSGIALLFVVFFEVVGLSWGFGAKRILKALHTMLGFHVSPIWAFFWKFTAPLMTAVLFCVCIFKYQPLEYPNHEPYPLWSQMFGFALSLASMICIPIYAIYYLLSSSGTLAQRLRQSIEPAPEIKLNNVKNDYKMEYPHQKGFDPDAMLSLADG